MNGFRYILNFKLRLCLILNIKGQEKDFWFYNCIWIKVERKHPIYYFRILTFLFVSINLIFTSFACLSTSMLKFQITVYRMSIWSTRYPVIKNKPAASSRKQLVSRSVLSRMTSAVSILLMIVVIQIAQIFAACQKGNVNIIGSDFLLTITW